MGDDDFVACARFTSLPDKWVIDGGWNIADCVCSSYDLEAMEVGTVGSGRIGVAVLEALKPFDVKLHYTESHRLPDNVEKDLNLTYHPSVKSMVRVCDVVTINAPLHPETQHLFNDALIDKMKRGAYLVNTARGKICDRDAVVRALKSGKLAGYAGDVWFPQPPASDHPWRTMPHHGMTPHVGDIIVRSGPLRRPGPGRSSNAGLKVALSRGAIRSSIAASWPARVRIPTALARPLSVAEREQQRHTQGLDRGRLIASSARS